MLTVAQAQAQVLQHARPLASARRALAECLGLVLAEEVAADHDSPPFTKALVDGYAVRAADIASDAVTLEVLEEVPAGAVPRHAVQAGQATRIMTGAPLPEGADAVVMVERSRLLDDGATGRQRVLLEQAQLAAGRNVLPRGAVTRQGERVLDAGRLLRAAELGVLAEVGQAMPLVVRRPRVAVLSTGDELVPPAETPGPGQIRNSNGVMLWGLARQTGAEAEDLGIARDEPGELARHIAAGLEADVLVITGGVSMGVLDLVPEVLEGAGVRQVFHKVRLKPGKPIWFGVREAAQQRTLVFGLPGNPVSGLVCFELFVRPALRVLAAQRDPLPQPLRATLTRPFTHRGDRPTYHPARLLCTAEEPERAISAEGTAACSGAATTGKRQRVEPLRWQGSADLRTISEADCLVLFPAGDAEYAEGSPVEVWPLA